MSFSMRAARINTGMSRSEMARKMEISTATLQKWEQGVVVPKLAWRILFAQLVGIPLEQIDFGEKD